MVGIARHWASSASARGPVRSSSGATTSGPVVVNRPPVSVPARARFSPSHHGSAGSGRQVPVIRTSTTRPASSRETSRSVSPVAIPRMFAASSDRVASRGVAPGAAQRPSTSVACSSIPSYEANRVRSVTVAGSAAASAYGAERRTRTRSPPVDASTRSSSGTIAAPASSRRSGRIRVRTTIARSAAGAVPSWRCRPASVTALVYSVPAASSDSALASRTHDARTTGQSARLRRSAAGQRPVDVGRGTSSGLGGRLAAGVTGQ